MATASQGSRSRFPPRKINGGVPWRRHRSLFTLMRGNEVAKKKKPDKDRLILADKLSLDEWLSLLGTDKWVDVFPNNCFPTDEHKQEYFSRIRESDERWFKNLVRSFLNKSGSYGVTDAHWKWVTQKYGAKAIVEDAFENEFDRRAFPVNGEQWEGITWTLDLLPGKPLDAIAAIRAYVRAHSLYFTDQMILGHNDVIDMIKARYQVVAKYSCFISFGGPDERFAKMLYDSLTEQGIQAFFFPEHAPAGEPLHRVMREGVNQFDRTIVICSKESLVRPGVLNELKETLQREAREGGKDILIPIRLDNYVLAGWEPHDPGLAQAVRDRVVLDFTGTTDDKLKYNTALSRLISVLEHLPTNRKGG
jgi:hypothetical protein